MYGEFLAGSSNLGNSRRGATYRILALIGHGAKAIDLVCT